MKDYMMIGIAALATLAGLTFVGCFDEIPYRPEQPQIQKVTEL